MPCSPEVAIGAGAAFIAGPVADPAVVGDGRRAGVAIAPGVTTPTEIQAAWKRGASAMDVFPAGWPGASGPSSVLVPLRHHRLRVFVGLDSLL